MDQFQLDMRIASHLKHYKRLKQTLEAKKSKAESIHLRKTWMERQNRANYQNEYDRIRGILSQTYLPKGAKRLEEHKAELEGLGITGPSLLV